MTDQFIESSRINSGTNLILINTNINFILCKICLKMNVSLNVSCLIFK